MKHLHNLKTVLVILIIGLGSFSAWASHIVGGEITYEFLGRTGAKNNYKFSMNIYRDIFGANNSPLDNPGYIAVYRKNATGTGYTLVQRLNAALTSNGMVAPPQFPCLTPPSNIGVENGFYTWDLSLDTINQSYVVVYQRCCRNATASNILNSGTTGSTYSVEITAESQRLGNSSPKFQQFPPILICLNEPINFNHAATDVDGDQLIYKFCPAIAGGTSNNPRPTTPSAPPYTNVNYRAPNYTFDRPLGGAPLVRIDPNTGLITGNPNVLGQFVVSVCVEEYRNGVLIGSIYRDFQFNVVSCRRDVVASVTADSIIGKTYFVTGCENVVLNLVNTSRERANINSVDWTFIGNNDTLRSTQWEPTFVFRDTGTYNGLLRLNPGTPCGDSSRVVVKVGGKIDANFSIVYDTCVAGPVRFTSIGNSAVPIVQRIWNFGDGVSDTNKIQTQHLYATPGDKNVTLFVKDQYGCKGDTSLSFNWEPAPPILIVEPDAFNGCAPGKVFFNNRSTPIDTSYRIVWDFGDGQTGSAISPRHTYEAPGNYTVKLMITSPIGCYKEAIFRNFIKIKPLPTANFTWSPDRINNLNPVVQFQNESSTDVVSWRWYFGGQGYSTDSDPQFAFRDTGTQQIKLYVTNQFGCQDSVFKSLNIEPEVTFFMPNAFTPNDDTVNDVFKGTGFLYGLKSFHLIVWNRWGEVIFETTDPNEGWNGAKNNVGRQEPAGVYLYEYEYISPKNERIVKKDFLTLYR